MKTTSFTQELTVNLPASFIYEMYMDAKKHTKWIGDDVKMSKKQGESFSVFGGYAIGKNISLMKDKKIIQTWCAEETNGLPIIIAPLNLLLKHLVKTKPLLRLGIAMRQPLSKKTLRMVGKIFTGNH